MQFALSPMKLVGFFIFKEEEGLKSRWEMKFGGKLINPGFLEYSNESGLDSSPQA